MLRNSSSWSSSSAAFWAITGHRSTHVLVPARLGEFDRDTPHKKPQRQTHDRRLTATQGEGPPPHSHEPTKHATEGRVCESEKCGEEPPLHPEQRSQGAYAMCGCLRKAQREVSHLGLSNVGTPSKDIRCPPYTNAHLTRPNARTLHSTVENSETCLTTPPFRLPLVPCRGCGRAQVPTCHG